MLNKMFAKFQRKNELTASDAVAQSTGPMINSYGRQLTASEIEAGEHRSFVGGLWDEVGLLQFEFMKSQGLTPKNTLVDVGCGAMRGGRYFVDYLKEGNYCGIDMNPSLIGAANVELSKLGLLVKNHNLLVNDKFEVSLFEKKFDYAIAISVFTHLYMNNIMRCLVEVEKSLKPNGRFYATFFHSPDSAHLEPILHSPGAVTTYYDHDPFHYSFTEMQNLSVAAKLRVEMINDWSHPRNQKMLCFIKDVALF